MLLLFSEQMYGVRLASRSKQTGEEEEGESISALILYGMGGKEQDLEADDLISS